MADTGNWHQAGRHALVLLSLSLSLGLSLEARGSSVKASADAVKHPPLRCHTQTPHEHTHSDGDFSPVDNA